MAIVYCKLPNGLHLDVLLEDKTVRRVATIKGNAMPRGADLIGFESFPMEAGFAITYGVDDEGWEAWYEQHKTMDIVTKGFVYASQDGKSGKAEAREKEKLRSGMDPIDPDMPGQGLERVSA